MDSRKPFSDRLDAKLDNHTPLHLRSVGKKMEEMYSEGGVCPHSYSCECDPQLSVVSAIF